jgi:hypothetical protein
MEIVKTIEVGDELGIVFSQKVLDMLQVDEGDILDVIEKNNGFELIKRNSSGSKNTQ